MSYVLHCLVFRIIPNILLEKDLYPTLDSEGEEPKSFGFRARLHATCIAKVKDTGLQRCRVEPFLIAATSLFWDGN